MKLYLAGRNWFHGRHNDEFDFGSDEIEFGKDKNWFEMV